ncbi:SDR family NAD(P)-dependent oxidoreductase [Mycolicibacterium neoaurum]|uniref:SDR family NAD(P)-dependent oxidoreductase n=1 Tax=Mycolicibacterium neoaurum TaxID=1795 RepID=UPI00267172EA|nr:SDR family NAD(P)-dependent oxidoreductase [Mycolicibacterium neoaurum]MDO3402724.1 SDR family NAD(P)-dependent oxidoreductase [Mycolicibacterium neoaurum]
MSDPFELTGKVALITGGTKGIGLAIARLFVQRGARVLVCGRDVETGRAGGESSGAVFHAADVTAESDVRGLIATCFDTFHGLDILVNNAGPTDLLHTRDTDGPIGEVTPASWHQVLDRTLTSAYLTTHHAMDLLVRSGSGVVVNISSIAAAQAMPGFDVYAAGKAGLEALTRSVAAGYGHLGVRSNAIRVGTIAVDHGDQNMQLLPSADEAPDAWRRATPPAAGAAEDVANAALFLASPASKYVTGSVIPVDGGLGARSLMPWQTPRPQERAWVC